MKPFVPYTERHGKVSEMPRVPLPVDVSDETAFPNIAQAIRHARALREGSNRQGGV